MKKVIIAVTAIAFLLIIIFAFVVKRKTKTNSKQDGKGFAVVELFTSEGCSSCPPADEALTALQKEYTGKNVLLLAFHVDYWNRLGWKDIFSSAGFTDRQNYYASLFKLNSIYTPQAIINGSEEFIGSNKSKLVHSIEDNLKGNPSATIHLKATENNPGKIKIIYSIEANNSNQDQLVLLLLQKQATNKIGRGENEGRILHHINIVRELSYLSISSKEETTTLGLPDGLKKEDVFMAGFTQNKKSGKITAISSSEIN